MKKNSTSSSNFPQITNIKSCKFYNSRPILKLFYLILNPKNYLFIYYPTNHIDKYIKNYKNKIIKFYKYPKYQIVIHDKKYKNFFY